MPPTVKGNALSASTSEANSSRSVATATRSDDATTKPQPVALEVPVTVNGVRTVEGTDKREPFSESTKTVLVFGTGAVIRLSSSVAPGQLLFLTNEKTKKEVVCQVVKSKNHSSSSGYVELEFTEPAVGFWGMRFPGDRFVAPSAVPTASSPSATAIFTSSPLTAAKVEPASKIPESRPAAASSQVAAAPPRVAETKPSSTPIPSLEKPATKETTPPSAVVELKPALPTLPVSDDFTSREFSSAFNLPRSSEAAPIKSVLDSLEPDTSNKQKEHSASTTDTDSAETLKQHTARLQEQLSSLLFTENSAKKPEPQAAFSTPAETKTSSEASAKASKARESQPASLNSVQPEKIAPSPAKSLLDSEELKIPAWLEPLARNAAIPAPPQEAPLPEEVEPEVDVAPPQEQNELAPAVLAESNVPVAVPSFNSRFLLDDIQVNPRPVSRRSGKGLLVAAIAAGILVAAAARTWYMRQSSNPAEPPVATTPAQTPSANSPAFQPPAPDLATSQTTPSTTASAPLPVPAPITAAGKAPPPVAARETLREAPRETSKASANRPSTALPENVARPAETQPDKPALGQVRLASPILNRKSATGDSGERAPDLSAGPAVGNADSLDTGLAAANEKQPEAPEAPMPVGGDVKPARLLSSVPPAYPALARSQHVSGDVKVDALIDANGRVTTMKIVSGPTLLHQAAMDALRQWKYRPATLDGKPVSMHLTVVLQFRLQ